MTEQASQSKTQSAREYAFLLRQYAQLSDRVDKMQVEREQWIRTSILATFFFYGWIGVYQEVVARTFMFGSLELQAIYALPIVLNFGGALRFFFIQRDINRLVNYLVEMERTQLGLPKRIWDAPHGRGIRDRHWHVPSICYWLFIISLTTGLGFLLGFTSI